MLPTLLSSLRSVSLGRLRTILAILSVSGALLITGCTKSGGDAAGPGAGPGGGGASGGGPGGGRGGRSGDVPVLITKVAQQNVPVEIQVVGNVEAFATITIRSQVGGELTKVLVREGDYVKADQPLFSIDPRPTQALLSQTNANLLRQKAVLSQLQAQMARDQAQAAYNRNQADRYQKLFEQGIMSKDQTEQTAAAAGVSQQTVAADAAAIESARADMEATKAILDSVKVQLGYTEIHSPINGRTGALLVKQGNLINANTMDMMTINQVQPIFVTFSVPEGNLSSIKRYMAGGRLPVFAKPQEDDGPPEQGSLVFIDNAVDMTTGTIKLKGQFDNKSLRLWPGQFVRVTLRLTTRENAMILPNQAVQTGQQGTYVYVVKQDQTVEARNIETGPRVDQSLVIEKGLTPGETVVLDGQLRLAPGSKVVIRDPNRGGRGGPGGGQGGGAQGGGAPSQQGAPGASGSPAGPAAGPAEGGGAPEGGKRFGGKGGKGGKGGSKQN